jgi:hypothetical protein
MARKKKKKPEPKTFKGYHEGQEVFCICISDGKLGYGRIHDFHPNCKDPDGGDPIDAFTLVCYMRGSYQTSYMSDIIDDPTPKQIQQRDNGAAALHGSLHRRSKKGK